MQLFFSFCFSFLPTKIFFGCVFTIVQQVLNYSCVIAPGACFLPFWQQVSENWTCYRTDATILTADSFWHLRSETKIRRKQSFCIVCTCVSRPASLTQNAEPRLCFSSVWPQGGTAVTLKKGTTSFLSSNIDFWIQCPRSKWLFFFSFFLLKRGTMNKSDWSFPLVAEEQEEPLTGQLERHLLS